MKKYSLDEIFSFEITEEVVRQFCLDHMDIAEDEEVRQACKRVLRYCAVPGEDYDGLIGPD